MAENETPNFGFLRLPDGDMVFGKDLNKVVDSIDEKLGAALGQMSEAGAAAGAAVGSAAWTQIVFDDETEIIFASKVKLTSARLSVINGTMAANVANLALALASAPSTPVSDVKDLTGTGGDVVFTFPSEVEVDVDEEIILIEKDDADTGFAATADVHLVVEAQKVL